MLNKFKLLNICANEKVIKIKIRIVLIYVETKF